VNESTAQWHEFGMEWKEHVAFLPPIAATVVAFVVSYYGAQLAREIGERRAVMIFFVSWAILHFIWKDRNTNFAHISSLAIALLFVGLIGTFPPFWHLLKGS